MSVDMDIHGYPLIWISMDIHRKSVDMDMDMDVKFHIHGNPGFQAPGWKTPGTYSQRCLRNNRIPGRADPDHLFEANPSLILFISPSFLSFLLYLLFLPLSSKNWPPRPAAIGLYTVFKKTGTLKLFIITSRKLL